ncbi:hypothetical protein PAMC26510_00465 [Caballeronia sordidicola]|uniref:Uncharacterized protein n=1 Tax=Caballeronia sordidicola TaxID=196367 RepID=A0A242NAL9_CABSO|nr:hypothetical protein PAMC26510_00465 [Caballeronia sordidicola]
MAVCASVRGPSRVEACALPRAPPYCVIAEIQVMEMLPARVIARCQR